MIAIKPSDVAVDSAAAPHGIREGNDSSGVFARLKQAELQDAGSGYQPESPLSGQWLQDQNFRTIETMIGPTTVSTPSEPDIAPGSLDGDLSLHRDPRGKYYYAYGEQQSAPAQSQSSGDDSGWEDIITPIAKPRPTSMNMTWLAAQRTWHSGNAVAPDDPSEHKSSQERQGLSTSSSSPLPVITEWEQVGDDIPAEVLQYLTPPPPHEKELTDCSACGIYLDSFRYVCTSCGPKLSVAHRREEEMHQVEGGRSQSPMTSSVTLFTYPPTTHQAHSSASSSPQSSRTVIGDTLALDLNSNSFNKALPSLPPTSNGSPYSDTGSASSSSSSTLKEGYELCPSCIESAGVHHALEAITAVPVSNRQGSLSPSNVEHDNPLSLSQWRRSAPRQKGTLRHVFSEKIWGHRGWEDVG